MKSNGRRQLMRVTMTVSDSLDVMRDITFCLESLDDMLHEALVRGDTAMAELQDLVAAATEVLAHATMPPDVRRRLADAVSSAEAIIAEEHVTA